MDLVWLKLPEGFLDCTVRTGIWLLRTGAINRKAHGASCLAQHARSHTKHIGNQVLSVYSPVWQYQ